MIPTWRIYVLHNLQGQPCETQVLIFLGFPKCIGERYIEVL